MRSTHGELEGVARRTNQASVLRRTGWVSIRRCAGFDTVLRTYSTHRYSTVAVLPLTEKLVKERCSSRASIYNTTFSLRTCFTSGPLPLFPILGSGRGESVFPPPSLVGKGAGGLGPIGNRMITKKLVSYIPPGNQDRNILLHKSISACQALEYSTKSSR